MRIDGAAFLARAKLQEGKPYIWDTKGPDTFDCSGLVTFTILAMGGPDLRATHNTARMFGPNGFDPWLVQLELAFPRGIPGEVLSALSIPVGTLVFYGDPGGVNHVMVATGDGRVFGATGGGKGTVVQTPGACVQFRDRVGYRPGVRGFRRLPEVLQ